MCDQVTSTTSTIPEALTAEREPLAGESLDQALLRLAIERLRSAADRIDAVVACDERYAVHAGHLAVAGHEMRAALSWLVAIGKATHDRPQNVLSYEGAAS